MDKRLDILLTEYEELTGRTKEQRSDISINDFLTLKEYSKKMKNVDSESIVDNTDIQIRENVPGKELKLVNETKVSDKPASKPVEKTKPNITSINTKTTSKTKEPTNKDEEDEVSILKAIID